MSILDKTGALGISACHKRLFFRCEQDFHYSAVFIFEQGGNVRVRQTVCHRKPHDFAAGQNLKQTAVLGADPHRAAPVFDDRVILTLDTYSHVLPSMQQSATDKLEGLLYKKTKK